MKLLISLPFLFIIFSCNVEEEVSDFIRGDRKPYYEKSDPYFDPMKKEFEDDYYIHTGKSIDLSKIIINITNNKYFRTNSYADGVCFRKNNEILIKKSAWEKMNDDERKVLFYHEIGHCALRYKHISHSGMMYPQWFAPYALWEKGYEKELLLDFFVPSEENKNFIMNL